MNVTIKYFAQKSGSCLYIQVLCTFNKYTKNKYILSLKEACNVVFIDMIVMICDCNFFLKQYYRKDEGKIMHKNMQYNKAKYFILFTHNAIIDILNK